MEEEEDEIDDERNTGENRDKQRQWSLETSDDDFASDRMRMTDNELENEWPINWAT